MFCNQLYVQSTTCVIMYVIYLIFSEKILSQKIPKSQTFFKVSFSMSTPSRQIRSRS